MDNSPEQLRADLMYLARRQVALEEANEEWTEFITKEFFKSAVQFFKHAKSDGYFKRSIQGKFKEDYEKFESLFGIIKDKNAEMYQVTLEE